MAKKQKKRSDGRRKTMFLLTERIGLKPEVSFVQVKDSDLPTFSILVHLLRAVVLLLKRNRESRDAVEYSRYVSQNKIKKAAPTKFLVC